MKSFESMFRLVPFGALLGVYLGTVTLYCTVVALALVFWSHVCNVAQNASEANQSDSHNNNILRAHNDNFILFILSFTKLAQLTKLTGFAYSSKLMARKAVVDRIDRMPSPGL